MTDISRSVVEVYYSFGVIYTGQSKHHVQKPARTAKRARGFQESVSQPVQLRVVLEFMESGDWFWKIEYTLSPPSMTEAI